MLLDSQAFVFNIQPENALNVIQRAVQSKRWDKYELSEIQPVYTPFYIFTYDINSGEGPQSGRAALNGNTGELNEYIPMLFEKPIKKINSTPPDMNVEVESTTINASEIKELAANKITGQTGAKKEMITISAISKTYVPFYRVWVEVADNDYKLEVDACLGTPFGMDAIPEREKTWEESTKETIKKMQTPSGIAELAGKTVKEAGGGLGKGKPENKYLIWIVLVVIIIAVAYFYLNQTKGNISCTVSNQFIQSSLFGLQTTIKPGAAGNESFLSGSCTLSSSKILQHVLANVFVTSNGKRIASYNLNISTVYTTPVTIPFNINFTPANGNYAVQGEILGGS
jgi:hypothetical protein